MKKSTNMMLHLLCCAALTSCSQSLIGLQAPQLEQASCNFLVKTCFDSIDNAIIRYDLKPLADSNHYRLKGTMEWRPTAVQKREFLGKRVNIEFGFIDGDTIVHQVTVPVGGYLDRSLSFNETLSINTHFDRIYTLKLGQGQR